MAMDHTFKVSSIIGSVWYDGAWVTLYETYLTRSIKRTSYGLQIHQTTAMHIKTCICVQNQRVCGSLCHFKHCNNE